MTESAVPTSENRHGTGFNVSVRDLRRRKCTAKKTILEGIEGLRTNQDETTSASLKIALFNCVASGISTVASFSSSCNCGGAGFRATSGGPL